MARQAVFLTAIIVFGCGAAPTPTSALDPHPAAPKSEPAPTVRGTSAAELQPLCVGLSAELPAGFRVGALLDGEGKEGCRVSVEGRAGVFLVFCAPPTEIEPDPSLLERDVARKVDELRDGLGVTVVSRPSAVAQMLPDRAERAYRTSDGRSGYVVVFPNRGRPCAVMSSGPVWSDAAELSSVAKRFFGTLQAR